MQKHHAKIIEQLDQLYVSSIELVSVITMFNCFIAKINCHEVGLQNLKLMKSQFDSLINDYLGQHVHLILDKIIDGLYEYNLMIEEMLEEDEQNKGVEGALVMTLLLITTRLMTTIMKSKRHLNYPIQN